MGLDLPTATSSMSRAVLLAKPGFEKPKLLPGRTSDASLGGRKRSQSALLKIPGPEVVRSRFERVAAKCERLAGD